MGKVKGKHWILDWEAAAHTALPLGAGSTSAQQRQQSSTWIPVEMVRGEGTRSVGWGGGGVVGDEAAGM